MTFDRERLCRLNGCGCVFGNSGIFDSLKISCCFFLTIIELQHEKNTKKRKYNKLSVNVKT